MQTSKKDVPLHILSYCDGASLAGWYVFGNQEISELLIVNLNICRLEGPVLLG
jgi:hypothetical protein